MKANRKFKIFSSNKSAYTQVVGGLVALLLTIIIGVLVFWEVNDAIQLDSSEANTSRNATTDMASTVFGLLPIVALVLVAAIILGVVLGFGGGKAGLPGKLSPTLNNDFRDIHPCGAFNRTHLTVNA